MSHFRDSSKPPRHGHQQCSMLRDDHHYQSYDDGHAKSALIMPEKLAWMTALLPTDEEEYRKFSMIGQLEYKSMYYLATKRVINWCPSLKPLYPVTTPGDGNCLMNAVALYIGQAQACSILMRNVVYHNLATSTDRAMLHYRWQSELEWQNANIPDGGLHYTDEEWEREWERVVSAATAQLQPQKHPYATVMSYEFLEEIHVFALANVMRRPIIVLGEPFTRGSGGDSLEQNNFVGIYLPLLFPAKSCYPLPIVLVFIIDHFQPLLHRYISSGLSHNAAPTTVDAVPLVTTDLEPLRMHFLLPDEQGCVANILLQQYLRTLEVEYTSADGTKQPVLCALLDSNNYDYELRSALSIAQPSLLSPSTDPRSLQPRCLRTPVPESEQCGYAGCSRRAVMKPPATIIYLPLNTKHKQLAYCRDSSLKYNRSLLKRSATSSFAFCRQHAPPGCTPSPTVGRPSRDQQQQQEIVPFSQPDYDDGLSAPQSYDDDSEYTAARDRKWLRVLLLVLSGTDGGRYNCKTAGCSKEAVLDNEYCYECLVNQRLKPVGTASLEGSAATSQSSEGRRSDDNRQCRGPCCSNAGLWQLRGLCVNCYRTLLVQNYALRHGSSPAAATAADAAADAGLD